MLDFLRRREMPPAGRQIGDARLVEEGDVMLPSSRRTPCLRARVRESLPSARYVVNAWPQSEQKPRARVRGGFSWRSAPSAAAPPAKTLAAPSSSCFFQL